MKRDIRDRWVEALRSGRYKQGQSLLHAGECFCALGVLCDVLGLEWVPFGDHLSSLPVYEAAGETAYGVPEDVCKAIGLEDADHALVAIWNDRGDSFAAIADGIESCVGVEL